MEGDSVESRIIAVERQIEALIARNQKVEIEKAWEISRCRKLSILIATYLVMVVLFITLESPMPWANALVPTVGFLLSTVSLPIIEKWWKSRR